MCRCTAPPLLCLQWSLVVLWLWATMLLPVLQLMNLQNQKYANTPSCLTCLNAPFCHILLNIILISGLILSRFLASSIVRGLSHLALFMILHSSECRLGCWLNCWFALNVVKIAALSFLWSLSVSVSHLGDTQGRLMLSIVMSSSLMVKWEKSWDRTLTFEALGAAFHNVNTVAYEN